MISIDVTFHSFQNAFYWFSSVIHEELIFHNISEKGFRTIHKAHAGLYIILKALNKGCILYTVASCTQEITVMVIKHNNRFPLPLTPHVLMLMVFCHLLMLISNFQGVPM